MTRILRYAFLMIVLALATETASAQVATGTPPFGTFGGGPEVINLANLNAHFTMPVFHKAGRGLPFNFDLTYDTSIWFPVTSGSTTSWTSASNWGLSPTTPVGYVTASVDRVPCNGNETRFLCGFFLTGHISIVLERGTQTPR